EVSLDDRAERALSAGGDGAVRLYRLDEAGPRPIGTPVSPGAGAARAVAFLPRGARAISCHEDGSLVLWNVGLDGLELAETLGRHAGPALAVSVDAEESRAASAGADGKVRVWDLLSRREEDAIEIA